MCAPLHGWGEGVCAERACFTGPTPWLPATQEKIPEIVSLSVSRGVALCWCRRPTRTRTWDLLIMSPEPGETEKTQEGLSDTNDKDLE